MNGGDIYGNTATSGTNTSGGGVCVAATFNMTGGTIGSSSANNQAKNGGGVCVSNGGSFTLNGGNVIYNTATSGTIANGGGGVYVQAGGTFTFTTGSINNNKASTNNYGSGGGVCMLGTFNWNGGTIHTNTAKNGGGIYLGANFTMPSGCELYSNTATINGGGVYVPAGVTFSMSGGEIYSNTATTSGGGVYVVGTNASTKGIFNMTGGTIGKDNSSKAYLFNKAANGAGVYVAAYGEFTMQDAEIMGNTATTSGGGVYVIANGTFSMTDSQIYGNSATTSGGGLWTGGTSSMSGGTIGTASAGNSSKAGGGVYVNAGTFNMTDGASITGNSTVVTSGTTGGGVHFATGTFNMTDSEITNNTANTTGGGIHMANGTLNLSDTEITGNTATTNGGGIYIAGGTSNLQNGSIVSNNKVITSGTNSGYGGGIYSNAGTLNISNSTIQGNQSLVNGGGIYKKGTVYVWGIVVIKDNLNGAAKTQTANNVFIHDGASEEFVNITADGLDCGSSIGITKSHSYTSSTYTQIAKGLGTAPVPANNCGYAYRNRFFFDDTETHTVTNSTTSPYYNNGNLAGLYFVKNANYNTAANPWIANADATGCTLDGNGFVTAVNNAAGMAYFAKQILDGKDYSNKTVSLTANIDLSGHNWEPIGYTAECLGNAAYFNGTFNGQGHSVSNITSSFPYDYMGLFGLVGEDGTVKNLVVNNINFTGTNTHTGAVAGLLNGAAYNCSAITLSGTGATAASLVGELGEDGSLMNCFVNTSATNGLADVNGGTIANCYMRGATSFVGGGTGDVDYCYAPSGSVSGTNSVYGATALVDGKYGFAHSDQQITAISNNSYITNGAIDNRGELKGLLATLNNWVRASGNGWNAGTQSNSNGYALWTRTMASPINGDYPVLMMPGTVCVGSPDGTLLDYATDLNPMITAYNNATNGGDIYLYAVPSTINVNTASNVRVYINEHVGVLQTANTTVNARVGITLDNSSTGYMSYDWHMFSSALTAAPMGLEYHSGVNDTYYVKDNYSTLLSGGIPHSIYTSVANMDPTKTTWSTTNIGYFPTNTPYGKWRGNDDLNGCFDFYCYAEPYCHWINFKREGVASFYDHWHQDADDNDKHLNIPYENELTMTQGKGYLVDLSAPSMLMADGVLNNGDASGNVSVNVTATDINFTGYEYALKGVNLIGNPYQSYLDFSEFNTTNSINTYFILDADQHGYVSYTVGQSDPVAPAMLHPHQGFFVRVSSSRSLQFTPSMRATTGDNFRSDTPHYPLVNLVCTDSQGRNDFATVELDRPEAGGGEKVSGLHAGDASIWLHLDDLEWQTAFTLPGVHEVPVRFRAYNDGMFTLGWETKNSNFSYMHLIDNLTGMDIDCLNASEYHFEGKTTDYWSRFRLVFEYTDVEENEEDGPSTGSGTFAFFMGDELVVNGPSTGSAALLQLFDINGHCVFSTELYDTQSVVSPPKVAPGIYILRLTSNQVTRTQKMVINK